MVWCCCFHTRGRVALSRRERKAAPGAFFCHAHLLPCLICRQAEKALRAELRKVHEAALAAYEAEAAEAADSRNP